MPGPAAWGWDEDQCWTLARITEIVRRRFRVGYTLAGLDVLLHRAGSSVQVPARQAAERDEARIARWREADWPVVRTAADLGAWTVYQLPPYAHELNPVELVWSRLKRSLANLAKRNLAQLTALAKTRLRRMQYRAALLDGFLGSTRLDLAPFCNPALKDRPSSTAGGC